MKRPTSITVIAWILIGLAPLGAIGLLLAVAMQDNPEFQRAMEDNALPFGVQMAMGFFGLALTVVCAIGMLKGGNWARFIYVGWNVIGYIISGVASPKTLPMMIPGLAIFIVITIFLFRPIATAYFTGQSDPMNAGGTGGPGGASGSGMVPLD